MLYVAREMGVNPVAAINDANASHYMSFFSFRKDEILRRKKLIDRLFAEGTPFFIFPFKIFWLITPTESVHPAQILISVSKRAFKHATDRNRIKRQIREAYRNNKHVLYDRLVNYNTQGIVAFLYTANHQLPSEEIDAKIKAIIKRLSVEIDKNLNKPPSPLSDKIKYNT